MMRTTPGAAAMALLLSVMATGVSAETKVVGNDGSIALPQDFRATMAHLGSWFVPEGPASGFHDVYTDESAIAHYRTNGVFPDGAVIVKELRAAQTGNYSTGQNVSSANSEIKQWFVMVKDNGARFPDNGLWGEGWGWALFKPDDPSKNVATDYRADCLGCHLPARDTDLIYVNAYPTLSEQ